MSQFRTTTLSCPGCGAAVSFEAVFSVNADRSPALRDRILDESFQRTACALCGTEFRLEPDFNYIDHGRALWIAAKPLHRLTHWHEEESAADSLFDQVYGKRGTPFMQNIGKTLQRRITFGWAAVREKLVCQDQHMADVTLELVKTAVLRNSDSAPVGLGAELRLLGADADTMLFGWIRSQDESIAQMMKVDRDVYDEVAQDPDGDWSELRDALSEGAFVDMNRFLVVEDA